MSKTRNRGARPVSPRPTFPVIGPHTPPPETLPPTPGGRTRRLSWAYYKARMASAKQRDPNLGARTN